MIDYPIMLTIGGLRVPIDDAMSLLERYDAIFTSELQKSIATAAVVEAVDCRLKITALTLPGAEAGHAGSGPDPESKVTRIVIRAGPQPSRVSGWLEHRATNTYLVRVPKGQRLEVRLERIPADSAIIQVVDAATGVPLNPRAPARARALSGRPLQDAEYRILVQRTAAGDPSPLLYTLSVSLR